MTLVKILSLALMAVQNGGQVGPQAASTGRAGPAVAKPRLAPGAFNPDTVVEFEGKIVGCQVYNSPSSNQPFMDILVKLPNTGTALVELGPQDLVLSDRLNLYMGDKIWVKGSKVTVRGDTSVLAQTVRHQGSSVSFRRADGTPFWK